MVRVASRLAIDAMFAPTETVGSLPRNSMRSSPAGPAYRVRRMKSRAASALACHDSRVVVGEQRLGQYVEQYRRRRRDRAGFDLQRRDACDPMLAVFRRAQRDRLDVGAAVGKHARSGELRRFLQVGLETSLAVVELILVDEAGHRATVELELGFQVLLNQLVQTHGGPGARHRAEQLNLALG